MIIKVKDLQNNMMGIYKIVFPNSKIYIGLSTDIKRRMYEHNNPHSNKTPCDLAINKYGKIEEIEILEFINDKSLLSERERYWIKYYQSNNKNFGYNLTIGGDQTLLNGENSVVSIFSDEQVLDIRKRRFLGERKKNVYLDYSSYSFSTFERVWLGRGYPNVGKEYLIKPNEKSRAQYSHEANSGINNGRAKCSIEDVLNMRKLFDNGKTISELIQLYPKLSKSTIRRIVKRESYKDIK